MPNLSEDSRAKLDGIVQQMEANGEPEDAIRFVVSDFKQKYALPDRPVSGEDFATTTLPYKGQRVPGDTFGEKIRNAASVLGGEALGGLKGLAHSAIDIGEMASRTGALGMAPTGPVPDPLVTRLRADTAYGADPAESFGGKLETAAELAAPALDVAKGGIALAQAAPALLKRVPPLAVDVATHLIPGGSVVRKGAKLVNILSDIVNNSVETAKAGPTLGNLNTAKAPTLTEALSSALEDVRAPELPARVTTPPPAGLPPGYTPRTTLPRPPHMHGGRKSAPVETTGGPAVPPPAPPPVAAAVKKRLYFLKPESELAPTAAEAPVTPSDFTDPTQLPASWRSRMDQPIAKLTAADVDAMATSMKANGISVTDALKAVSTDPTLAPNVRIHLLTALGKMRAR